MGKKLHVGDKVGAVDGLVGKVIAVDSARDLVAVKATEASVGASKGAERTYRSGELEKQ